MSAKKRKKDLGVQVTLWPLDEFDQIDDNTKGPTDEELVDDLKDVNDPSKYTCNKSDQLGCSGKCVDCDFFGL